MGNKLSRKKQVVEERYTRPHGLYANKDVDIRKLRKLILETKLAPCYPGDDECCNDQEECPICFLYYPSLNRSRCCMKSICTECFLQMKNPDSTRPTQCPFCKTLNYAVEYRGVKTKKEKGMERIEEQRVIEAKIRMRQEELQDEEERTQKRLESCSLSTSAVTTEMEYAPSAETLCNSTVEEGEIVYCQDSCASSTIKQPLCSRPNRDDEFDVDLEDLMVMEAIWLSIQERGGRGKMPYGNFASYGPYASEDRYISPSTAPIPESSTSSSPSGGLACAVAALAERQQMTGESSNNIYSNNPSSSFDMHPNSSTSYYNPINMENSNSYSLEIAEPERQSYRSSNTTEDNDADGISTQGSGSFQNLSQPPPPIMPESYEEQMMLAMAVSLAEVHPQTSVTRRVAWQ